MSRAYLPPAMDEDPKEILGISDHADGEEIRRAYLDKIRQYPPDRMPAEFEKIRDAYEILKNPGTRTIAMLRSIDPKVSLLTLVDGRPETRRFVGPEMWLEAMKEKDN
jgi:preprotein translocase subunit Sec63